MAIASPAGPRSARRQPPARCQSQDPGGSDRPAIRPPAPAKAKPKSAANSGRASNCGIKSAWCRIGAAQMRKERHEQDVIHQAVMRAVHDAALAIDQIGQLRDGNERIGNQNDSLIQQYCWVTWARWPGQTVNGVKAKTLGWAPIRNGRFRPRQPRIWAASTARISAMASLAPAEDTASIAPTSRA
jgi:hypothetical protein